MAWWEIVSYFQDNLTCPIEDSKFLLDVRTYLFKKGYYKGLYMPQDIADNMSPKEHMACWNNLGIKQFQEAEKRWQDLTFDS